MKSFQFAAALFALAGFTAASPLAVRDTYNCLQTIVIDDASTSIKYSGKWTHLTNQDQSKDWKGTESFTNDPNGSLSLPMSSWMTTDYADNVIITLFASTKADRGYLAMYLDNRLIGYTTEYYANTDTLRSQPMYIVDTPVYKNQTLKIVNKEKKYIQVDSIQFVPCPLPADFNPRS